MKLKKTAVSLGMFDGLHLGHRKILQASINYAKLNALKSVVLTFSEHPRLLTGKQVPKLVTDLDLRIALFKDFGIDEVLVLEFNKQLMNLSAQEYLDNYLKDLLNADFISVGFNHHFAKDRSGDVEFLKTWCLENSIKLHVEDEFRLGNEIVSSSRIRSRIALGDIEGANEMLGYHYKIISEVIRGKGKGRELGFKTANLKINPELIYPANGVYYGLVKQDMEFKKSLINIGHRPSFDDGNELSIEVHILDFEKNLYGKKIEIEFHSRIRDEIKFENTGELINQIKKDVEYVKQF